jgi:hypothetical protein
MTWWAIVLLCLISFYAGIFLMCLMAVSGRESRREEQANCDWFENDQAASLRYPRIATADEYEDALHDAAE